MLAIAPQRIVHEQHRVARKERCTANSFRLTLGCSTRVRCLLCDRLSHVIHWQEKLSLATCNNFVEDVGTHGRGKCNTVIKAANGAAADAGVIVIVRSARAVLQPFEKLRGRGVPGCGGLRRTIERKCSGIQGNFRVERVQVKGLLSSKAFRP